MADQILTSRDELTTLATGDKVHIVDVSDTTDDAAGTSKWFLISRLSDYLKALTQTLTNKTIDADNNTITNIALGAEATGASTDLTDTAAITYNADTDVSANGWVIDEDAMGTDSNTKVPTQQSVKAYVDSGTVTMTNKRITQRVSTEASSATPTINTDNVDAHSITALAAAVTSMTTNLSGTPTNFQKLIIRFLDDGTGRAITWGASFQSMGATLPTTTTASKVLTVGLIYDTVDSKWGCVAAPVEA